jgi:tRNA A-37 threonylcarbamoyl transferase component Bud32
MTREASRLQALRSESIRSFGSAPPWWVATLALVYGLSFCYVVFFEVWGIGTISWKPEAKGGGIVLTNVAPGSSASGAGLLSGDRIVGVGDQPIRNALDWVVALSFFRPGNSVDLLIERQGHPVRTTLTPRWAGPWSISTHGLLIALSLRLPAFIIAILLIRARPREPRALVGAWLMGAFAAALDAPRPGMAAAWKALPGFLAAPMWIPYVSGTVFGGAILFTFAAVFPSRTRSYHRATMLAWIPALGTLAWLSPMFARIAFTERTESGDLDRLTALAPVTALYLVSALAMLAFGYSRIADLNERRRIRVIVGGALLAFLAPLPVLIAQAIQFSPARPLSFLAQFAGLLGAAFPLAFGYALLRHRLFDIRMMVRAGVRYALARRVLLSIAPVLGAFFVVDLLQHGSRPLLSVIAERGWLYAGLMVLAILAHSHRDRWLDALDHRFFRERFEGLRSLRDLAVEVQQASPTSPVVPDATSRIASALHTEFVVLMLAGHPAVRLEAAAVAPAGPAPPSWPAGSRLVAFLRFLNAPLEVGSDRAAGLLEELPSEEFAWIRENRVDLVVPIALPRGEAFFALGPKASQDPYDRDERDVLMSVAAGLTAWLVNRDVQSPTEEFPAPVPLLGDRYRLGPMMGSGGMGVVYEAVDTALKRRIAVKVLHESLSQEIDSVRRFRREAQALATFSHPNVVIIHDFGIGPDGRAYLVMEYLVGETLRRALSQRGRFADRDALSILGGIASAADAAHRRRLVHRDLKPENVFLARGENGEIPKVLDFGLAKLLPEGNQSQDETASRAGAGTPRYMAPEQITGGVVDPAWDLWALGVIAYELLTGKHPFRGSPSSDWRGELLAARFAPLDLPEGDRSTALNRFFARALALEPRNRPSRAEDLVTELDQALGRGYPAP